MVYVGEKEEVYITQTVFDKATGLPQRQETTLNDQLHAPPDGSPSRVLFDEEGEPYAYHWHAFGVEHRTDGPAAILMYSGTQTPHTEDFMINGKRRPANQGPFRFRRDRNGRIERAEFASVHGAPENGIEP